MGEKRNNLIPEHVGQSNERELTVHHPHAHDRHDSPGSELRRRAVDSIAELKLRASRKK